MGLDIYLKKYKNREKTKQLEDKYDKESDKIWKLIEKGRKYEELSEKERDTASALTNKVAEELGLSSWGSDEKGAVSIEESSSKYPDHLFKVGYFRSSYNDGGINHILKNMTGQTLYEIFPHEDDTYEFQPDWEESKRLAERALEEFRDKIKDEGAWHVSRYSYNQFRDPDSYTVDNEEAALKVFLEQQKRYRAEHHSEKSGFDMSSYGNIEGEFHMKKPLPVHGIIMGFEKGFFGTEPVPCTYLVWEDEEKFEWYTQALEIVIETCDWVLAQKDKSKYWISWSS
jgi:hypothetical protein